MCLKDSRNKRKTEQSGVLMLITTVCLFSICITLTLIFYHWHTLSLYPLPTIWHHIFHKILYTAISLHSLHYYARKRPILGLIRKGLPWNPVQKNWVLGLRYLVYTSLEVLGSSATSSCITVLKFFFKAENLVPQVSSG